MVVARLDGGTGQPLDRYRRLVVTATVRTTTTGVSDDEVRRAVQEGTRVTATLRCDVDRYVLTGLRLAP